MANWYLTNRKVWVCTCIIPWNCWACVRLLCEISTLELLYFWTLNNLEPSFSVLHFVVDSEVKYVTYNYMIGIYKLKMDMQCFITLQYHIACPIAMACYKINAFLFYLEYHCIILSSSASIGFSDFLYRLEFK